MFRLYVFIYLLFVCWGSACMSMGWYLSLMCFVLGCLWLDLGCLWLDSGLVVVSSALIRQTFLCLLSTVRVRCVAMFAFAKLS